MTLSISNSDKHSGLLVLLLALLTFGTAVVLMQLYTDYQEKSYGDIYGIERIRTTVKSLDFIAEQSKSGAGVVVFGSSMIKDGFSPRDYQQALRQHSDDKVISFNLGLGNMKPAYQLLLAQRLRDAYQRADQQLALAVIEFNPFLATQKRQAFRLHMSNQIEAVLMSNQQLLQVAAEDPQRFAQMLSIRWLRNGISAQAVTANIAASLRLAQNNHSVVDDKAYERQLEKRQQLTRQFSMLLNDEYPVRKNFHRWDQQARGGLIDMTDLSKTGQHLAKALATNMRHPQSLQLDLAERIACCDILDLNFSETAIVDFIAIVNEFKAFSKHVKLVVMPINHKALADAKINQAALEQVLERLRRQTGIEILNHQQNPLFDTDKFYDLTHLAMDGGRQLFSQLLAKQTAAALATAKQ